VCTFSGIPVMAIPTSALFLLEQRGYSKLYDKAEDFGGLPFLALSFFTFMLFTDGCIYWIHRWLHIPWLYKHLHKLHHKWKVPTPFASHAFHPIDGFLQSVPYHIYPFLFPLHKLLYLGLFVFVNIWSTSIHDHDFRVPKFLQPLVNGCAHHTDHHLYFTCNYGEYLTLWDRIGGSFRDPSAYNGDDVHDQVRWPVNAAPQCPSASELSFSGTLGSIIKPLNGHALLLLLPCF
jgi:Delta7-sterol 5-desaturase